MRRIRRLLALTAALAFAGCISLGPTPPKSLIRLTAAEQAPADTGGPLTPARAIVVMTPSAPQPIAVPRVPVSSGVADLAYLKDATYADVPTRLFGTLLAETIRARTGRPVLEPRDYSLAPGARLWTHIARFDVDAGKRQVDLVVDEALRPAADNATPATRRFEAHLPVDAVTVAAVAPVLDRAANQVAQQIADWIGR